MEYQFHNHLDGGKAVNLEASQNGLSSTKLISSLLTILKKQLSCAFIHPFLHFKSFMEKHRVISFTSMQGVGLKRACIKVERGSPRNKDGLRKWEEWHI